MTTPSALPENHGRAAKLVKYFDSVVFGVQALKNTKNGNLFIEALCIQHDPPTCIERLVSSSAGLLAMQTALRFDDSAAFQNGPATNLIQYMQYPALKTIHGGKYLHKIVLHILEPPFFWNPFLSSFRNGLLTLEAQKCFGWLLSEILIVPGDVGAKYIPVAQDPSILAVFFESRSYDVRKFGHSIKHITTAFNGDEDDGETTPGGRHDNDFVDFREIAIHPTADELLSEEPPFLRVAQAIDASGNEHRRMAVHLDNQFRLLREDMLSEMRDELQIIFKKKQGRHRGLIVDGLTLLAVDCGDHDNRKPLPWGLHFQCALDLRELVRLKPKERLDHLINNRNIFKHQSLACLIVDGEIVSFPTIHRDVDQLARKPPVITLQLTGKASTLKTLSKIKTATHIRLVQIDTAVFAFEPVLKGLQDLRTLPFVDELLFWSPGKAREGNPHAPNALIARLEGNPKQNLREILSLNRSVKLDESQLASLLTSLKQRLSLIQGPPGTGKSFIGALIAKSIYQFTNKVILVVCYKNHALDQFLEDLLDIGIPSDQMVRLGGQCTPRTKCMSLFDQAGAKYKPLFKALDELRAKAKLLASHLFASFSRYQEASIRQAEILEYLEFLTDGQEYYEAFSLPESEDGSTKVGRAGRAVNKYYLMDRWCRGQDAGVFSTQAPGEIHSVWQMSTAARHARISTWQQEIVKGKVLELQDIAEKYNDSLSELDRMRKGKDASVIGSRRIVACTTTAAAKYAHELQAASRDVVLVEEAGEILESHILTALATHTQQLVLIGDHKQLRPKASYQLSVEKGEGFDLNRSLFERLVLKDFPHETLNQQHRMRPEISVLVRSLTYPDLIDASKTQARPSIRGLQNNLIFISHSRLEDDAKEVINSKDMSSMSSKQNRFEVDMVLKCVKYLAQQGYGTEKIVVLTPYLGQLQLLRTVLGKDNDPVLSDIDSFDLVRAGLLPPGSAKVSQRKIRLATIDNYQGEESDIVIASLTRSNNAGDIGFMAFPQRLNVLLSRARNGLILIGNTATFLKARKGKEFWTRLFDLLKRGGNIYDGLPIKCERHPERMALLREPNDFENESPDGGCTEPCKCEAVAKKAQKDLQRALQLQEKRDREEREHSERMAKLEEMLADERQKIKGTQVSQERTRARDQKEQDLRSARELANKAADTFKDVRNITTDSRLTADGPQPISAGINDHISDPQPREPTGTTDKALSRRLESTAEKEWKQQKKVDRVINDAIDSIMAMIGLEAVKTQVLLIKAKVDACMRQNSDMKSDRLNVVFLGNPGTVTGKTTVARLYAKVLTSLGALPGHALVETTGSRLASDGVGGIKKALQEIHDAGGGALFLDEAYQLVDQHNYGGKQVLDFLLAEMEDNIGKIVFILAGYNKEMESFFEHNPGLTSRFLYTLQFTDYQDDELLWMLQQQMERRYQGVRIDVEGGKNGLYMRIAVRRLGRGRGRPGFGNARALQTVLSRMAERQAGRLSRERREGLKPNDFFFSKEDLIGPDPSKAILGSVAWEKLQELTGLGTVKRSIKAMIDRIAVNFDRELNERSPIEVSLNRVFLGSPVVVKNPADFVGSALGQSESNTKAILATTLGKVLIIDEAYSLYSGTGGTGNQNDPYKTAVIDTMVAEVQSVPGEDRCVLLLGYEDQMRTMFQNVNAGLSRRFANEDAFRFEDFTDSELLEILNLKLRHQDLEATDDAKAVAIEVLSRARHRPNFGNAGEVENLLGLAKGRFQARQSSELMPRRNYEVVFEPQDFDPEYKRGENASTNLQNLFKDVVGCEDVIEKLAGYQQVAQNLKSRGRQFEGLIPTNFLFKGPPGTGKTTTARKMGQVFFDLGMLSVVEVVECSASDLIGSYVGQTGPKARAQLEKALGKVLFIDEAYRLAEGDFAKEAINELVDLLTKPYFMNKLIVILAGYDKDINNLISVNPGLSSRFPEQIIFRNMSPEHCLQVLEQDIKGQEIETPPFRDPSSQTCKVMISLIEQLASLPSWGNARDIKTLAKSMIGSVFRGTYSTGENLAIDADQILHHTRVLLRERQERSTNLPPSLKNGLTETYPKQPLSPASSALSAHITSSRPETVALPERTARPLFPQESQEVRRDDGVSDETWSQLQMDAQAAQHAAKTLKECLLKEETTVSTMLVEEHAKATALRKLSQAQANDEAETQELKRKREEARLEEQAVREARENALKELEKLRLQEAKQRREEAVQAKLRQMGVCCAGFQWIKQSRGYRCAGGSHWVSNKKLGL